MTRPEIIRADTIDLQAHDNNPSAQRHHRPPPAADGSLAPHQAETLREVAAETAEENLRSPPGPGVWNPEPTDIFFEPASLTDDGQQDYDIGGAGDATSMSGQTGTRQDALAIAQNGGVVDDGDLDGETGEDMDDDMMDKISSSPSIEDGWSTPLVVSEFPCSERPPNPSPKLAALTSSSSGSSIIGDARSSSPYLECPDYGPMSADVGVQVGQLAVGRAYFIPSDGCYHHHHLLLDGEYERGAMSDEGPDQSGSQNWDPADDLQSDDVDDLDNFPPVDNEAQRYGTEDMRNRRPALTRGKSTTIWPPSRLPSRSYHPMPRHRAAPADNHRAPGGYDDDYYDSAEMTVPYESDQEDDDDDDLPDPENSRLVDSGWGGESLQDTEDIDFDFVYALHTFVATVEGQANATKGDTMVLLDDSNSYWWLVRVVKDSSIGYLPAEHIETPTERLARLNKHRNIDLSATMLGDQSDKTRNPIKSAMKRRKAKTVQFAPPTFVDYSDIDYSTEEEDAETDPYQQAKQQAQQNQQSSTNAEIEDESAKVEPLKPRLQKQEAGGETDPAKGGRLSEDESRVADGPKKTSDGTVRDSFFKDDTVETKKITLTPNLLRDDDGTRASTDSKEMRQRPSLDRLLDKDGLLGKDDKKKKDKKEKDKKAGGIRSFFSRKDKKNSRDDDDDSFGRDIHEEEEPAVQPSPERTQGPQRQPSKLQKPQPRTEPSPTRKPGAAREPGSTVDMVSFLSETKVNNVANVPPATMRIVESSPKGTPQGSPRDQRPNAEQSPANRGMAPRPANGDARPRQAPKAKSRMELDDFDSDDDMALEPEPVRQAPAPEEPPQQQQQQQQQQPRSIQGNINTNLSTGGYQDPSRSAPTGVQTARSAPSANTPPQQHKERLSESPIHVSPVTATNPPPLMVDTSSQEEDRESSPISSPSPELIDHEEAEVSGNKGTMTPSTSSRSSWNDTSLRAFFDNGSDIRDLLVVVYDKTNTDPVTPDHPAASGMFREQNAKLAEITTQLDNMLGDWLARKQRMRGSV
ncbi:hypothetical protein QBC35DRAFT_380058 [Podospora australis]|uniref:SH3 domain-containing protein n=1 Tax=Podospora australis TaxID=1536484 RepID=A0AAN6WWP7_9PEZI|nr:hypothetical protein QBC35DRAFT_380058 [Podospora australis]